MDHVLELPRVPVVTWRREPETLAETIRAVASGDQDAFARLYADYVRLVHAIVLGRVPRRDVDDVVQDVFLTAYVRVRELRDPAAFGGWIAAIARNRATGNRRGRNHCRRRSPAAIRSKRKRSPSSTWCGNSPTRTARRC